MQARYRARLEALERTARAFGPEPGIAIAWVEYETGWVLRLAEMPPAPAGAKPLIDYRSGLETMPGWEDV